jgi:hypothetical protein
MNSAYLRNYATAAQVGDWLRISASGPFDLERQEFKSGVRKKDAECHSCGVRGDATAHFQLVGPRAEPTEVKFKPDPH